MPILQMTKLRIKEVKLLTQGHRATKSHLRIQTQDGDTPEPTFLHEVDSMGVTNTSLFAAALRNSDSNLIAFVSSRVTHSL